jgi:hypothetical protein
LFTLLTVSALFGSSALLWWLYCGYWCWCWCWCWCRLSGWRRDSSWLGSTLRRRCGCYGYSGRCGLLALLRVAALFGSAALLGWLRSGCRWGGWCWLNGWRRHGSWLGCTLWRRCGCYGYSGRHGLLALFRVTALITLLIVATLLRLAACISRTGFGACRRRLLGWWGCGLCRSDHFDSRYWHSRNRFQFFAGGFVQRSARFCIQLLLLCRETHLRRRWCGPGDDWPLKDLGGRVIASTCIATHAILRWRDGCCDRQWCTGHHLPCNPDRRLRHRLRLDKRGCRHGNDGACHFSVGINDVGHI